MNIWHSSIKGLICYVVKTVLCVESTAHGSKEESVLAYINVVCVVSEREYEIAKVEKSMCMRMNGNANNL